MTVRTKSLNQTLNLGKQLAKSLSGEDVLTLSGELGAGKTAFVKGLARGLGIKKIVRSPSFNLMRIYRLPHPKNNIKTLAHLDCYRLSTPEEAIDIGLADYLADQQTLVVIEWPEKIKKILPKNRTIKIRFKTLSETARSIILPCVPRRGRYR